MHDDEIVLSLAQCICGASDVIDVGGMFVVTKDRCGLCATLSALFACRVPPGARERGHDVVQRRARALTGGGASALSVVVGLSGPDATRHDNRARGDYSKFFVQARILL